jgi:ribosomal protein S13
LIARFVDRSVPRYNPSMGDANREDQYRDPVVEALVRDVDMTLIRRNLEMTPQQRLEQLMEMQRFAAELREAGRKVRGNA